MQVKDIVLCFENCEVIRLNNNMFKYLNIEGIKEDIRINCYQYENGEVTIIKTCEYFSIEINEIGLKQKCWNDMELRDRIKFNDITSIILKYEDDKEEEIYVVWSDYSDYENSYQKNKNTIDNKLKIEIVKGADNIEL